MSRRKKKFRLPYWIRSQNFRLLNNSEKDFLGYLYYFGPDTCWQWNCRLQKKFHRSRRTIQYWLAKLKDLGFVWIENPFGDQRKIHTRVIPSPDHWVKLIGTLALERDVRKHGRKRNAQGGFPPPLHKHSSSTTIEQTRHAIITELVHRGESFKTAAETAKGIIAKSQKKKGLRGCKKLHPRTY